MHYQWNSHKDPIESYTVKLIVHFFLWHPVFLPWTAHYYSAGGKIRPYPGPILVGRHTITSSWGRSNYQPLMKSQGCATDTRGRAWKRPPGRNYQCSCQRLSPKGWNGIELSCRQCNHPAKLPLLRCRWSLTTIGSYCIQSHFKVFTSCPQKSEPHI